MQPGRDTILKTSDARRSKYRDYWNHLVHNPQFQLWSIISVFLLITIHHYEDLFHINLFFIPDKFFGLTRHTIDRVLYLFPIILSSFAFYSNGGLVASLAAFIAMVPRAIFV